MLEPDLPPKDKDPRHNCIYNSTTHNEKHTGTFCQGAVVNGPQQKQKVLKN